VFFTYPVDDGQLDATAAVAAAARAAGVRRLVEVSQLTPRPHAHSPRTRQHWLSEQIFDWADVGVIHLRATVFFENIRALAAAGAAIGELAVPLGDDRTTIPLVGATLGIPLQYTNVDEQKWREQALARGGSSHAVEHLSRLWQVFGNAANRDEAIFHVTDAIADHRCQAGDAAEVPAGQPGDAAQG
jgi:hypothetical protein